MSTSRPLLVFRDPPLDGATNMARDEHLLSAELAPPAALRIYGWNPPTLSLGCFQRFDDVAALPPPLRGLAVVRRQTGGGAILHDAEITYCLVVSAALPIAAEPPAALYRLAHECWRDALAATGVQTELAPDSFPFPTPRSGPFFCFQKPGRTDLIVGERKVLGSAQRRVGGRVLQHGSLVLARRFEAHPGTDLGAPPPERVEAWIVSFIAGIARRLGLTPAAEPWSDARLMDVAARRAKYASDEWTRRR